MKETVLVVGAEWQLAQATAMEFARNGYRVYAAIWGDDSAKGQEWSGTTPEITTCALGVAEREHFDTALEQLKAQIDVLDYLIVQEDCGRGEPSLGWPAEEEAITAVLDHQVCGVKSIVDAMLPQMRKSAIRRMTLLSAEISSINLTEAASGYAFHLAQSALHMMLRIYFNMLRPEGFTFRCAAFAEQEDAGKTAYRYITCNFSDSPADPPIHSEENRLVMRTEGFREIPW